MKPTASSPWFKDWFAGWVGLDLRSLALFRIGLALLLLTDIGLRWRDVVTHYSDAGVVPRWMTVDRPSHLIFHQLSGSPNYEDFLFGIAAVLALLLLAGYRTRWVCAASWLFLASVQARNPLVNDGAQDLLRLVTFWSIFLPLGAKYSVDAALNVGLSCRARRVVSMASFALMAQMCCLYWFAYMFKTGPEWRQEGSAVYYTLSIDMLVTPIGKWMLNFPRLLRGLTYFVVGMEGIMPLVFFFPFEPLFRGIAWIMRKLGLGQFVPGSFYTNSWNPLLRGVQIVLFCGLHIGFAICMWIELFPWLCVVAWMAFIPSQAWDWVGTELRKPKRRGLSIYYDQHSLFCLRLTLLMRTFLMLSNVRIRRLDVNRKLKAEAQATGNWVLVAGQRRSFFGWAGVVELMRRSPIARPLAWFCSWGWVAARGQSLLMFIARRRKPLGEATWWLPLRQQWIRPRRPLQYVMWIVVQCFVAALLLLVVNINMEDIGNRAIADASLRMALYLDIPDPLGWGTAVNIGDSAIPVGYRALGRELRLDQHWAMFSPNPLRGDGWFVMSADLADGRKVDLWTGEKLNWEKPEDGASKFPNYRWFKYMEKFLDPRNNKGFMPTMCQVLGRQWNENHPFEERVITLKVYFVVEVSQPSYVPLRHDPVLITECQCSPPAGKREPQTTSQPAEGSK
ncbi:MAG: HTTM domain-containing protein [Planctomycetia bacterium]|nr:HTTM domain-containing protein [Planctomycetia bacterium]